MTFINFRIFAAPLGRAPSFLESWIRPCSWQVCGSIFAELTRLFGRCPNSACSIYNEILDCTRVHDFGDSHCYVSCLPSTLGLNGGNERVRSAVFQQWQRNTAVIF